ncbi:hypothetical protein EDD16DRAFT_1515447 [Pisolithus croceorrhizus]|nr:hypothetical protein EV401DRAFT_2199885 [Pisolithus croceorrhizus]KAI6130794.1 hypothetical protein EDD16DRAFT_1515447 [Pisolithus croceorrhizus]
MPRVGPLLDRRLINNCAGESANRRETRTPGSIIERHASKIIAMRLLPVKRLEKCHLHIGSGSGSTSVALWVLWEAQKARNKAGLIWHLPLAGFFVPIQSSDAGSDQPAGHRSSASVPRHLHVEELWTRSFCEVEWEDTHNSTCKLSFLLGPSQPVPPILYCVDIRRQHRTGNPRPCSWPHGLDGIPAVEEFSNTILFYQCRINTNAAVWPLKSPLMTISILLVPPSLSSGTQSRCQCKSEARVTSEKETKQEQVSQGYLSMEQRTISYEEIELMDMCTWHPGIPGILPENKSNDSHNAVGFINLLSLSPSHRSARTLQGIWSHRMTHPPTLGGIRLSILGLLI